MISLACESAFVTGDVNLNIPALLVSWLNLNAGILGSEMLMKANVQWERNDHKPTCY